MNSITIVGAGLAGCEAAWYLANRGIKVTLYEMKPNQKTPAHSLDTFGELVCSNSLRSDRIENAVGLLKYELRELKSLIMEAADATKVPAGGALAVDRESFSKYIDDKIRNHENIQVVEKEIAEVPEDEYVIIATGPLTSDKLADDIMQKFCKDDTMYFYDAVAPIINKDSINMDIAFKGSRYERGDDYVNCPMSRDEYYAFYNALIEADTADIKGFEESKVFEGCMPIESMAKRGPMTMAFGPLKPVGIDNPHKPNEKPFAVVQLRQDNAAGTLFNIVGFQTRLKVYEQKKVFSMIPGLENAEFFRYGVMHRNTYINSPKLLETSLQMKARKGLYMAGQMMGVEGYVESCASGIWAAINAARDIEGKPALEPDSSTMIGAIIKYTTNPVTDILKPMNANYGLMLPLDKRIKNKKDRAEAYANRACDSIEKIKDEIKGM
ncbi:MAG: methylenetetrahydrofolate--tRNA-(uracil(54)-C(5))-methyltransferase (FADH(2)-oxidizing) TrmFO [Eubacteriales bacterium]